jgi:hypothetical protein
VGCFAPIAVIAATAFGANFYSGREYGWRKLL